MKLSETKEFMIDEIISVRLIEFNLMVFFKKISIPALKLLSSFEKSDSILICFDSSLTRK